MSTTLTLTKIDMAVALAAFDVATAVNGGVNPEGLNTFVSRSVLPALAQAAIDADAGNDPASIEVEILDNELLELSLAMLLLQALAPTPEAQESAERILVQLD